MKKEVLNPGVERKIKLWMTAVVFVALLTALFLMFRRQPVSWEKLGPAIEAAAEKHRLPPELVEALIWRESKFYQFTEGKHGEIGLMQLLPRGAVADWARINGCPAPAKAELFVIERNLDIGCWYLARCFKRYEQYAHGAELALAQYNAGAANADKYKPAELNGEVIKRITINSTRRYVKDIMERYRKNQAEKLFQK